MINYSIILNTLKQTVLLMVSVLILILSLTKPGWTKNSATFNLSITHIETERIYSNETTQTKVTSITGYRTEKVTDNFGGSLILGYQEQIQDKNSIVAAQYAIGYFGGVQFNYDVINTSSYRFNAIAKYQYHKLEGKDGEQEVKISWYDVTFGIRNYLYLSTRAQLLADVVYIMESGTQRALDPISQTINFENKSDITYSLGLAYYVDSSGYVVVKWFDGARQGFQLLFAKDF